MTDWRRVLTDYILAAVICAAVGAYWLWDNVPQPTPPATAAAQPQPAPASMPAPTPVKDPLNDGGYRLYSAGDYRAAEVLFRKAIQTNPSNAVGFSNLGAALIAQKKFDEAIGVLRAAIMLDPSLTLARNNLNWALEERAKRAK